MKSKIYMERLDQLGPHTLENGCKTYITYRLTNEENGALQSIQFSNSSEEAYSLLYTAAKMICFADCTDEQIEEIVIQGWKVEYCGWQPGMFFQFRDAETKEVIWSRIFSRWEH